MFGHISVHITGMNRVDDKIRARILVEMALLNARQRAKTYFRDPVSAEGEGSKGFFKPLLIESFGTVSLNKYLILIINEFQ